MFDPNWIKIEALGIYNSVEPILYNLTLDDLYMGINERYSYWSYES